jgi:hypothetical protein
MLDDGTLLFVGESEITPEDRIAEGKPRITNGRIETAEAAAAFRRENSSLGCCLPPTPSTKDAARGGESEKPDPNRRRRVVPGDATRQARFRRPVFSPRIGHFEGYRFGRRQPNGRKGS